MHWYPIIIGRYILANGDNVEKNPLTVLFSYIEKLFDGGALSVIVILIGNRISDQSSNPGCSCLPFPSS